MKPSMKPSMSGNLSLGVTFVLALGAAFAVGAWQGRHASAGEAPVDLAAEHSTFVQSGGVVAEPDRSVPDAAEALTHARAPGASEASASTF
jgi:hypothetical protein